MMTAAEIDTDSDGIFSESELEALTIAQLKAFAAEKGYTVTKRTKADIIDEILLQQLLETADANSDGEYSEEELTALTVEEIMMIAEAKGYTITETEKTAVITEFLTAQAASNSPGEDAPGED